ncbi:MAG TPA: oxygenase MpaB family protein [Kofleriaceae bacterium]|jgi:uncharacterized protein (DUF2236 family)
MHVVGKAELEASLARLRAEISDPRAGILGPDSAAWRIGGDLALFLGGGRAAMLQLAHPAVAQAIEDHSATRADAAGRFQRTFTAVFAMIFGTLDAAFTAARRVHAVHSRIRGVLPSGAPYEANDAAALRWVHATLVDTVLVVRERLDGELPLSIKDAYIGEMRRFAALFGIDSAPDFASHDRYMATMLAPSSQLAVLPCAREMAGFLVGRGDAQPRLGAVAERLTASLLPPHLAAAFGLRTAPRRVRLGLGAFGALYARLPPAAVAIPAHAAARSRLGGAPASAWTTRVDRAVLWLATRTSGTGGASSRRP